MTLPPKHVRPHLVPLVCSALYALLMGGVTAGAVVDGTVNRYTPLPSVRSTVVIKGMEGTVEMSKSVLAPWQPAQVSQFVVAGERVRTGERSRATLLLGRPAQSLRIGELSELAVIPPLPSQGSRIDLKRGLFYFLHRGPPEGLPFETRTVSAIVRGTEFHVDVREDGTTRVRLFDGVIELKNPMGSITLIAGEEGIAEPGQPPRRTAVILAHQDLIQWCLYYPGILDPDMLPASLTTDAAFAASLAAYRSGDLLEAVKALPHGREPGPQIEQLFRAALLLAAGRVEEAEPILSRLRETRTGTSMTSDLPEALQALIRTVRSGRVSDSDWSPESSTGWLARSYEQQAALQLEQALAAARRAVSISPSFGLGWVRVAELEFGFGRIGDASRALTKGLELAPLNAQAQALEGFLLAAEGRLGEAEARFDQAMLRDGGLGNAWLGRGLCRIRRGLLPEGVDDLHVAATVEPARSLLRSYLAKGWHESGATALAAEELRLARELDPADPTPWLYQALVLRDQRRFNEAIQSLHDSLARNDNRRLYRSGTLLDQDRAVRGASLASTYRQANLVEWGLRQAGRAVESSYAYFGSHLFLAESYNALRDPARIDLRYETAWLSEYLLANLLAPVRAGAFSPSLSQNEYSPLFERDRLGFVSASEYQSSGSWSQSLSHSGLIGNTAYEISGGYVSQAGDRPNSDLEERTGGFRIRQAIDPANTLYLDCNLYNAAGGNLLPYQDPSRALLNPYRYRETQAPTLLAGYHHEWHPGSHTLLLAGLIDGTFRLTDPQHVTQLRTYLVDGSESARFLGSGLLDYQGRQMLNNLEVQQILESEDQTLVAGLKLQQMSLPTGVNSQPVDPGLEWDGVRGLTQVEPDFSRLSLYAYHTLRLGSQLNLQAGGSLDAMTHPLNHRYPPLVESRSSRTGLSPKAGFSYSPSDELQFRAAHIRSLTGTSFDQSFRLEPTQITGFNQAYRSLIPEALEGANGTSELESTHAALEWRPGPYTRLELTGDHHHSRADRSRGVALFHPLIGPQTGQLASEAVYREGRLGVQASRMLGPRWTAGVGYTIAEITYARQDLDPGFMGQSNPEERADLSGTAHQVSGLGSYQSPKGWFAIATARWIRQEVTGTLASGAGDSLWQSDLHGGYRGWKGRLELHVSVLNVGGMDHRLSPIHTHTEFIRGRTIGFRVRVSY